MNKWLKPYAEIEGDQAKQIGLKFIRYGEKKCFKNILISYGTCDKIDDETEVIVVDTEGDLLKEFAAKTREYDPEFIIGYNIFNFDFPFLYHRAEECGPRILDEFQDLGRIVDKKSYLTEKHGKVKTLYLEIPGRIQIDIYKILQREQPNLDSYKLDNVSSHFIKSKIKIPDHIIIRLLGIFITFHFVCFCWIFFRASNMQIAGQVLTQIFTDFRAAQLPQFIAGYRNVILLMILGYALHFMPISIKEKAKALFIKTPFPLKALAVIAMIILVVQVKSSEIQPFIYFQF
jgi:hypothetical protein